MFEIKVVHLGPNKSIEFKIFDGAQVVTDGIPSYSKLV